MRGFLVAESTLKKLQALLQDAKRIHGELSQLAYQGKDSAPHVMPASRILVSNQSGETIPRGGIMRITGKGSHSTRYAVTVAKPNATLQHQYLINGSVPIVAGASGYAADLTKPVDLIIDSGTPSSGQSWGPKANSFKAVASMVPWLSLGDTITHGTDSFASILWEPLTQAIGKADADIAAAASGTVSIWYGTAGSEADSSIDVTAYTRNAIGAGNFVAVTWLNGHWEAAALEC